MRSQSSLKSQLPSLRCFNDSSRHFRLYVDGVKKNVFAPAKVKFMATRVQDTCPPGGGTPGYSLHFTILPIIAAHSALLDKKHLPGFSCRSSPMPCKCKFDLQLWHRSCQSDEDFLPPGLWQQLWFGAAVELGSTHLVQTLQETHQHAITMQVPLCNNDKTYARTGAAVQQL